MQVNNKKCVLCGRIYDQRHLGLMDCWIHPSDYDFNLGYYPCCGQTRDPKHKPYFVGYSKGCTKIDHMESRDEIEEVLLKPFTLIPFIYSKYVTVLKHEKQRTGMEVLKKDNVIIPIEKSEDLNYGIRFISFFRSLELDPESLYQRVLNADYEFKFSAEDEPDREIEDDSITNYFHYQHRQVIWDNEETFIPFYIVRRMEQDVAIVTLDLSKKLKNQGRYKMLKKDRNKLRDHLVPV